MSGVGIHRSDLDGGNREFVAAGVIGGVREIKLDLAGGRVYWAERFAIRRAKLDGTEVETIVSGGDRVIEAMTLDLGAGTIYYKENIVGIWRADLDGSNAEFVFNPGSLNDMDIDTVNDKLYYSRPIIGLHRCDLDGTNCVLLVGGNVEDIVLADDAVYYNPNGDLWRTDLDGSSQKQVSSGIPICCYLALGFDQERLYCTIPPTRSDFVRADFDGSNLQTIIVGAKNTHDVAVDAINERLYFTDVVLETVIGAPLDGSVLNHVAAPGAADGVRGLTLDQDSGRLYWAQLPGAIWAINVDGSDRVEIVPGLSQPHDVALDTTNGKIYWTQDIDAPPGTIRRANLDGSNVEDVITGLTRGIRGIDVDPAGGKIYWTDHVNDEVNRANEVRRCLLAVACRERPPLAARGDRIRTCDLFVPNAEV